MSSPSAAARAATVHAGIGLELGPPRWLYFAIFTISGFSGLIYESIWSHYLKLFLGHAATAQSLVLIIFMGGLAVGSWLAARYSDLMRSPILLYAVVEGVIGVIALVFHDVFVSVSDAFFFSLLPSLGNPLLGNVLKWTAAAALIVPQSVLLGATFPLLTTGILRRYPDQPGGSLAMLYFTNSLGAAVGVLVSGFWLIAKVGLPGTIMTAGLLNIALALVVWALLKLDPHEPGASRTATQATSAAEPDWLVTLFLFAAGATGAASFIYEIGWIRMLSLVLGSTTHSFELMLSAFITGLAFGGLWIKRRIDRIAEPVRLAGWVQVLMGVLAAATLPLYVRTFDWMAAIMASLQRTSAGYDLFTALSHGIALLVMVPTTFLAGMTLPLFTYVLMRGRQGDRAIGHVYAANTLGSIVGVLFAVHIGLPLLGLKNLILLGAALDIGLGLVLLGRAAGVRSRGPLLKGALVGGFALAAVAVTTHLDPRRLASGVYRYQSAELDASNRMLFYRDGKTASISLMVGDDGRVIIATNGKPDASIQLDPARPRSLDEITMMMAAALPLAYHPDARVAANIGLGSGLTTHTLLGDPSIRHVDTIEIEPAMVLAAQGFGERVARTYADPRSAIHVEDAKTFFSLHNQKYDVIVAEPSNPWVSGVASLFSGEFYRSVRSYLAPDGVFVQWLQLYEFNDDLALSVFKALTANFSDYAVYNTDGNDVVIIAKSEGKLDAPRFEHVLRGELGAQLASVGLRSEADFLVRKTGSKELMDSLVATSGVPANSDYFPFLDLHAGEARFRTQTADFFRSWGVSALPILEMLRVADYDHDAVIADASFLRTMMIGNARATAADLAAPGGAASTLELLRSTCDATPFQEAAWSRELDALAVSTLPFLDAEAAVALLDSAAPARCFAAAPAAQQLWLRLYRAVAARDAAAMAATGEELLANGPNLSQAQHYYALVAATLGRLVNGEPERALALWDAHRAQTASLESLPDLRLILQLARSRARPPA